MKIKEILESASVGATGSGAVASVSNPPVSKKAKQLGLPTKQGSLFGTVQKRSKP